MQHERCHQLCSQAYFALIDDCSVLYFVCILCVFPCVAKIYFYFILICKILLSFQTVIGLLSAIFVLPWLYNSVPRSFSCLFWQFISFISFSTTMLIHLCSSYVVSISEYQSFYTSLSNTKLESNYKNVYSSHKRIVYILC